MKMKRTVLMILTLALCLSLFSVTAFADQTVVIIGGAIKNESPQNSTVIAGTSNVITADASKNNVVISKSAEDHSSVIVMPGGTVVSSQPAQSAAAAAAPAAAQTRQDTTAPQNTLANEIYKRINQERVANGLGILGYDSKLQGTADLRAKESASVFGHTRPDGTAAVTAVTVDYTVAGENLIQVTKEFASVGVIVETWLASETHKANIMLADFSQTAIGVYESNGTLFISQIFTD